MNILEKYYPFIYFFQENNGYYVETLLDGTLISLAATMISPTFVASEAKRRPTRCIRTEAPSTVTYDT